MDARVNAPNARAANPKRQDNTVMEHSEEDERRELCDIVLTQIAVRNIADACGESQTEGTFISPLGNSGPRRKFALRDAVNPSLGASTKTSMFLTTPKSNFRREPLCGCPESRPDAICVPLIWRVGCETEEMQGFASEDVFRSVDPPW